MFAVKVPIKVEKTILGDILETALVGSMWVSEFEVVDRTPDIRQPVSDWFNQGFRVKVTDDEDGKSYVVDQYLLLHGIKLYLAKGRNNCGGCIVDGAIDPANIDQGDADCILQYAIFKDIIYG